MKLLLFSDLHTSSEATHRLARLAEEADVLVGAGDFANVRQDIHVCLDILGTIDRPMVLVAGNNETTEELTAACRPWPQMQVLHGSETTLEGVCFFGLGGAVPVTPFGSWSYDLSENEAARLLASCPENAVLISHSPPQGVVDVASSGKSLGSCAVRKAILEKHPRLVVCGHIHASGGEQGLLGTTPVVNAGPGGILWDLP